ncbi:MAG: LysM peptidoglycan-binding domain-containing protein [Deltaproteobacteria bacterium]|nr:LysM peptidoglycan-binding domain-containing protein [Deltaproteobacteria bacterium]
MKLRPIHLLVILSFSALACAVPIQNAKKAEQPIENEERISGQPSHSLEEPAKNVAERSQPTVLVDPSKRDTKRDTQAILDEALEFCQASQDFWGQGDFDLAVSALDRAYALILQADTEKDPKFSQQKEDIRLMISRRLLEIYTSQHTVVNGSHKAIPLDLNPEVLAQIEIFKGPQRRFFLNSYRRSGRFRSFILAALKEAGLPEELSWLPLIESGFKIRALSSARALGLWQFIPSTGYRFGLKRDKWVDERMHVKKATRAAIGYLTELHKMFGDWTTALAAYNCGENRVLRVIRRQNINYLDNFWDLYQKLPKETRFYVPRFLAILHILKDPAKHGFELTELNSELSQMAVIVNKQLQLKDVAKKIKVPLKSLEELNPELRRQITPPSEYKLLVPADKGKLLQDKLAEIKKYTPPKKKFAIHTIQSGETLSHLSKRYHVGIAVITKVNKIRKNTLLQIGQKIKIPLNGKSKRRGKKKVRHAKTQKTIRHKVKRGDSLWEIARRYKTDVRVIKRLNKLGDNGLRVGQELVIVPSKLATRAPANTKEYIVKAGDSPYEIANRHSMKLERFLRLNRLSPKTKIFPGQSLLVNQK